MDNLTGSTAGWIVRVPIVLDTGHRIWSAIIDGNIDLLRNMFSKGEVTPFVVDETGSNLLRVSYR